jgi:hypothetical protein
MPNNPYSYFNQFPRDFQFVDQLGMLMPAWQYFLLAVWQKLGSGQCSVEDWHYISSSADTPGQLVIVNTGGSVVATPMQIAPKEAPAPQLLATSPWTFTAPASGFLTLSGGQVEYSRDGITYYPVSMTGGQVWVLGGDHVQVIWYGTAPQVVWWQGGVAG